MIIGFSIGRRIYVTVPLRSEIVAPRVFAACVVKP
jgi:hypothetical protein